MKYLKTAGLMTVALLQLEPSFASDNWNDFMSIPSNGNSTSSETAKHNWTETFIVKNNDEKFGEITHSPTMIKEKLGGQSYSAGQVTLGGGVNWGVFFPRCVTLKVASTRDEFIDVLSRLLLLDTENTTLSLFSGNGEVIH